VKSTLRNISVTKMPQSD